ncbi:glycoside hydrolase family 78 protein [Hyaloscypha hepaticicola]|uniref:Glycoside hydrolase family 78 protein n=1 Tax=Hyaloscypha hepaticicola TaxID=2082293 RepID=A0A2J6PT17_9HELO|nr:glycoside hydrolase family 78 protein [Hyaloscypha hepaticicola]
MFLRGILLFHSFTSLWNAIEAAPYEGQARLTPEGPDDWQKYVRSPPSPIVYPARIVASYTQGNVTNPEGLFTGKGSTLFTRNAPTNATSPDIPPTIVVDFGQNIAGYLSVSFGGSYNSTPGRPGIRLAFSETLEYLTDFSDFSRGYNGDTITPGSDQIAVSAQPYTWKDAHGCEYGNQVCADGFHGFRYVKVYLDALAADAPYTTSYGQVAVKSMSMNFSGYLGTPETFTGWFKSSDEQLNQWWFDGVYTTDLCTDIFGVNDTDPRNSASPSIIGKLVLHDGAKRDRDPYVGDLAVSARTSYLSHDIPLATRNVLADLADHQRADGWIPPASINGYTLPLLDYPLWWVVCSYDLFMYTGDTAYIQQYYPNIIKVLDTFYPSITDSRTQLLSKGFGVSGGYGDYAFIGRTGPVTYYNALYVLALQNAATIANFLSNDTDAARWTSRAQLVSSAINTYNFDSSVGAFYDGTCGDSYCNTHAQDGNSLSIVTGVANSSRANSVLSYLSQANARPYGNAFYDNDVVSGGYSQRVYAFVSYFEIEARFIAGQADTALEEIRRLYGWMSTHDPEITQWEGIGPNGQPYEGAYTSMAHGWGTGIVPVLTNYILGVIPSGHGFSIYTIKPVPGDIEWAKGVVPTPKGPITVNWQQKKVLGLFFLTATAPAGTQGTVYVPVSNSTVPVYLDSIPIPNSAHERDFEEGGVGYVSVSISDSLTHTISVGYNAGP